MVNGGCWGGCCHFCGRDVACRCCVAVVAESGRVM